MKRTRLMMVTLLVLATGSCGGSAAPERGAAMGSPGPALVVERFLQAANANDLETMMQLFGSATRTIDELDGRAKAERRMHVLATLLRHDDFAILGQQPVPGRLNQATQLQVQLRLGTRNVVVPHQVVRRKSGGWIIEKIDIEKLTQRS